MGQGQIKTKREAYIYIFFFGTPEKYLLHTMDNIHG